MKDTTPAHLAFIVDGNRRWARERGLATLEGHRQGFSVAETVAESCFQQGVQYVTLFLFSLENWDRSSEEVDYLMRLAKTRIDSLAKRLSHQGVRVVILGSRDRLSPVLLRSIDAAEELSKDGTAGTLGICFNYGGQREIADAASQIRGEITPEKIRAHLYHPEIPDIDMIVRTSGEQRLSGFMLWRASYAELLFLQKYWPDMTPADVTDIITEYTSRHRRFGK